MNGVKNFSVSSTLPRQDPDSDKTNQCSKPIIQEDGFVRYIPSFLSKVSGDRLLEQSLTNILWKQDQIQLFGKLVIVPRLSAWFSSVQATYKYSGLVHRPKRMPHFVIALLQDVVSRTGIEFNSILANLYLDGSHSMGWHADDEPELGPEVTIASLTVGSARVVRFRHRHKSDRRIDLSAAHGSLLLMYPPLQKYWLHAVPKRKNVITPRVNFSFRVMNPD